MKKLFLAFLPLLSIAQPASYWQQKVDYTMDVDFNVEKHQFTGHQKLVYTNNSPDTIKEVFYHLYYNAFQPGSMMDVRSLNLPDPDHRIQDRIGKLKPDEIGYHKIDRLTQDGEAIVYRITHTLLQGKLAKALPPGGSTVLEMDFSSQVPVQIRRTGRNNEEGIDYTMTQWYPKLAAYDEDGWHPYPYVAREFYADFGRFDIRINIDSDYVLGGTGVLQNQESFWREAKDKEQYVEMEYLPAKEEKRTWRFVAEQVHDFAWAADPDYTHLKTTGPDSLELNFYYLSKYKKTWRDLPAYTVRFFELMNKNFGQYIYPQFSVLQGGDGGMEYPMSTMLKGTGKLKGLVGVMVHEAAHSWYHGMLASNEILYPWMDEGFTTFAEDEVLNKMKEKPVVNPHLQSYANYLFAVKNNEQEPMSTAADYFSRNRTYGISSYSQGSIFLVQLRHIMGEKDFNRGMLEYYLRWKVKHPDPMDFLRVMEEVSGLHLNWYYNFWIKTTKHIDYSVNAVEAYDRGLASIELERKGEMPMPVELTLNLRSGETQSFFIPLVSMFGTSSNEHLSPAEPWAWTHPIYVLRTQIPVEEIQSIVIDQHKFMADVDRSNNTYEVDLND